MIFHSIRWKLSLSFAGIALLTILALGAALLLPLRTYYRDQEYVYLKGNAGSIALGLTPLFDQNAPQPRDLQAHMKFLSFLAQARLRLVDMQGTLLADSGSPGLSDAVKMTALRQNGSAAAGGANDAADLIIRLESDMTSTTKDERFEMAVGGMPAPPWASPFTTAYPAEAVRAAQLPDPQLGLRFFFSERSSAVAQMEPGGPQFGKTLISVVPVSKTMYGFELFSGEVERGSAVRSDQVFREQVFGADGQQVAWVELSEGPAYGYEIVTNVARGWAIASLVAVLVAATVGWWISRRMSAPLTALTGVTRRMAGGDLSARASINQPDEFGSLGRAFNEMAGRVEGTVSTLRRFASDAAHELHTPLTALRTNLELAQGQAAAEGLAAAQELAEAQPYLQRAAEQVLRLEHLTNDLLDLSRIEGGSPGAAPAPLELGALVARVCEPCAAQAEQAGIDFALAVPDEPLIVRGQEHRLEQAVVNLVDNALKFTPSGGRVSVSLARAGDRAVLQVDDTGIGIDPEDLPILFQRFHRGRAAAGYPGSGLGLSIVKAVCELHDGTVTAENTPAGARFILSLPLIQD